jgi:hypothetical protein
MGGTLGDLDLLPDMSPVDGFDVPPMPDRARQVPLMTMRTALIIAGIIIILVCAFVLFFVYAVASMVAPELDGSAYWTEVFTKMFALEVGGAMAIPALTGILMGLVLVVVGVLTTGKRAKKGSTAESHDKSST